jgi:hypothetical protein
MAGDEQRMVYESVEAMVAAFKQAASMIEDIRNGMGQVAQGWANGAFDGNHGRTAQDAINQKLALALQIADQKCHDLGNELHQAVVATQNNDSSVGNRFLA